MKKYLFIFLIFGFALSAKLTLAANFDTAVDHAYQNTATQTTAITIGNNADREMGVQVYYENGVDPSTQISVSLGAVSGVFIASSSCNSSNACAYYYLINPPIGTANITVVNSGGATGMKTTAVAYYNTDTAIPPSLVNNGTTHLVNGNTPATIAFPISDLNTGIAFTILQTGGQNCALFVVTSTDYTVAASAENSSCVYVRTGALSIPTSTISTVSQSVLGESFLTGFQFMTAGFDECDTNVDVSMSRPADGASVVNDFPTWIVNTSGTLEGCQYKIVVGYSPQIGSIVGGSDDTNITVTPDNNPTSVSITKTRNIWNFYNATTTQINLTTQIINTHNGINLGYVTSTFYLAYSATSSPLTAPVGFNPALQCGGVCSNYGTLGSGLTIGSIGTASATIAVAGAHCTPASDWTDIGGGIAYGFCSTINFLFVPNDTTQGILAGDMNALQSVPPFSWFFATNNAIMNAAQNTDHLTPNLGVTYEIAGSSVIATTSLTIIPADMASISFAGNAKWAEFMNVWFNFLLTAIIIFCIIMIYKIAL